MKCFLYYYYLNKDLNVCDTFEYCVKLVDIRGLSVWLLLVLMDKVGKEKDEFKCYLNDGISPFRNAANPLNGQPWYLVVRQIPLSHQ